LVGIKPTVGVWGRSGIIPIAHSQDTAGPMARSLADAVAVLGALSAVDPNDPASRDRGGEVFTDYSQFLDAAGLKGARIGVGRQFFGFHERVDSLLEEALEAMKSEGAELVEEIELPRLSDVGEHSYQVLLYEFKADLNAYLAQLGPAVAVRSLADLIRFNEENRDREMPYFEQEIFEAAEEKGDLSSPEYLEALATCKRLAGPEGIDAVMDEHRLDALFAPTGGPPWKIDLVNGDHFGGGSSTAAAVSGYPNITVPGGYVRGLPVGVSFFGRAFSEPTLIRIAYAFEQATKHRVAPRLAATLDLGEPV
jgi:amidase